ncbi:MAG TPA: VOC family protein [Jiangellaceae bacterium]|nr:VOC family protein [Jiangellaceae bacterium]
MKISSISGLVYQVRDLDKTLEFYESLGFRMGKRDDHEATCYVNWFWLRFVVDADGSSRPEPRPTLYLKVDDIDDYYGALLANGFTPSTEPRKQRSGTREFLIDDPDGYTLAFFAK